MRAINNQLATTQQVLTALINIMTGSNISGGGTYAIDNGNNNNNRENRNNRRKSKERKAKEI